MQAAGLLDERTKPICQKHGNYTSSHSQNEQCSNQTVPAIAPAAPFPRVIAVFLNEVERWSSRFFDCLEALFLRLPTHKYSQVTCEVTMVRGHAGLPADPSEWPD